MELALPLIELVDGLLRQAALMIYRPEVSGLPRVELLHQFLHEATRWWLETAV